MRRRPHLKGLGGPLAIIGGCACAALGTLLTKSLLADVAVLPLVFFQIAAGTAAVWAAALVTGQTPSRTRWAVLAAPGILQPGLSFMLSFLGLAMTPVSVEGLLFAFESVLVALLAWPLIGERASALTLGAAAVGAAGVFMIGGGAVPAKAPPVLGVALIMAGVTAAALDTIAARRLAVHDSPLALTAASSIAGAILVGLTWPWWPAGWAARFADPRTLALTALSGLLLHGAAVGSFNFGLSRMKAAPAAALFPLISVLTTVGGVVWFGERLTWLQLGGGALVLAASLAITVCLASDNSRAGQSSNLGA